MEHAVRHPAVTVKISPNNASVIKMSRRDIISCLSLAVFTLLHLFFPSLSYTSPTNTNSHQGCDYQIVSRVIDGDTFELSDGRVVRLMGVDTAETVDPREDVQWFGREAAKKLRKWILGKKVCLKKDREQVQDIDKYGRLLRYVWNDGFLVNAELIKQGYGFALTIHPFQYLEDFRRHERKAREGNLGLWDKERQKEWEKDIEKSKSFAVTCGKGKTICPQEAVNYIGKYKTVRFFVVKSYDSGKAIFLNSKNDFRDHGNFTAIIFKKDRNKFSAVPADYYWGKTIDVVGRIKEYEGRAEIILEEPFQIRILK